MICDGYFRISLLCLLAAAATSNEGQCNLPQSPAPSVLAHGTILDITKELTPNTHTWDSPTGLGNFRERYTRIEDGDLANQSQLKDFPVHLATHVDHAGHFIHESYETGKGIETADLYKLNGQVLVIDVPHDTNITAAALEELHVPAGVKRLIFKTLNSARGLMHETPFHRDYVAMTKDGAEYLAAHTDVELVGIDYTSIAYWGDLKGPHVVLFTHNIMIVEGLVLDNVSTGLYTLHCLPLKIVGSDGAPARCILVS